MIAFADIARAALPHAEAIVRRGGRDRSSLPAANKFVERLQKNRNRMFTFLDFDDVPWNNNNAEHAVKAFALLRRVIDGLTTEKGLRDTLVLLSVCETCKCKNIDFLDFLRSGSKDIDDFAMSRQKRSLRSRNSSEGQRSREPHWNQCQHSFAAVRTWHFATCRRADGGSDQSWPHAALQTELALRVRRTFQARCATAPAGRLSAMSEASSERRTVGSAQ